jgi:hypothetical protein
MKSDLPLRAADDGQLVLPETVCATQFDESAAGCCGGPPVARADACCVKDEKIRNEGGAGCGCGDPATKGRPTVRGDATQ